ncbi:MAG: hypothetical protein NVS9B7_00670 [Flavisolibacter sp.]
MDQLFEDIIIDKVNTNERRLSAVEQKVEDFTGRVATIADQSNAIKNATEIIRKVSDEVNEIKWPLDKLSLISKQLTDNNELLDPRHTKKIVVHTVVNLIWVIIGLLIIIMLCMIINFNMHRKLN